VHDKSSTSLDIATEGPHPAPAIPVVMQQAVHSSVPVPAHCSQTECQHQYPLICANYQLLNMPLMCMRSALAVFLRVVVVWDGRLAKDLTVANITY
jgi:hypothetical protein